MNEAPTYRFDIKLVNSEGIITPDAIVRSPRVFKPQDLQAACHNTQIVCLQPSPAPSVVATVRYVLIDFFALAHRTGLYNRQKSLWESLSKVTSVSVFKLTKGFFRRQAIPFFDLRFQDQRGRTVVLVHVAEPAMGDEAGNAVDVLKGFLKRAERLPGLTGLFLCFPEPFPLEVTSKVSELTGGADPVGRYESVLPPPLAVPLNLLELTPAESRVDDSALQSYTTKLVHPDLTASRRFRAASVNEESLQ